MQRLVGRSLLRGKVHMQTLNYEKDGKKIITSCPYNQDPSPVEGFPGVAKIGSAACEKYCRYFVSHNCATQRVECNYA